MTVISARGAPQAQHCRTLKMTMVLAALCATATGWYAEAAHAQEWRGRVFSRASYVEARPLLRDSVPIGQTAGTGQQRLMGDTLVTCTPGATHCFFYRPVSKVSTTPVTVDVDLSVWGFGIRGLRGYVSTRLRTAVGSPEFWPRTDDHFDLLTGYLELDRGIFRARAGRDYQTSGLGFYGYDGASVRLRLPIARSEVEAYGGWGLARGLPEPVNSDALASLDEFLPRNRNYLFGFRASARPVTGASIEAIYQREIETDRSGIASERVGIDANYIPFRSVTLQLHADYDLATGWWGKAGLTAGWSPVPLIYLEGRVLRYRPVFSLQTIWAAFSPTPYSGWGVALGLMPRSDLSLRFEGERRQYADTEAEVPFQVTTDRTWRAGASIRWRPTAWADLSGSYGLNFSFGAALSAGDMRFAIDPLPQVSVGARFSAFQQLEEFRVGEGRVWGLGGDARWETSLVTFWGSVDRYRHDRRDGGVAQIDWNQVRASFGLMMYLGSEPGRAR